MTVVPPSPEKAKCSRLGRIHTLFKSGINSKKTALSQIIDDRRLQLPELPTFCQYMGVEMQPAQF